MNAELQLRMSEVRYHITSTVCEVEADCGLVGYHIHVRDQIFYRLDELEAAWPYESIVQDVDLQVNTKLKSRTKPAKHRPGLPTFTSTLSPANKRLRVMVKWKSGPKEMGRIIDIEDVNSTTELRQTGGPIIQLHPNGEVFTIDGLGQVELIGYWRSDQ